MSDLVNRLRDENLPMSREEVAKEVEQLERELVAERDMVNQLAGDLGDALSELAAEKSLAARLADDLHSAYIHDMHDEAEEPASLAAYRKARGL